MRKKQDESDARISELETKMGDMEDTVEENLEKKATKEDIKGVRQDLAKLEMKVCTKVRD